MRFYRKMDSLNHGPQIRGLIEAVNLIAAIKPYRATTGFGLAEAKKAVEAKARGENAILPQFVDSHQQNNNLLLKLRITVEKRTSWRSLCSLYCVW